MAKKVGKQDDHLDAGRQIRRPSLMGAVAPGHMGGNANTEFIEQGGDVSQAIGTNQHGVHDEILLRMIVI